MLRLQTMHQWSQMSHIPVAYCEPETAVAVCLFVYMYFF